MRNVSRRSGDGKRLFDEAVEYMRIRRNTTWAKDWLDSSSKNKLGGPSPQKFNLKVNPQKPQVAEASPWSRQGQLPILDETKGWICI